MSVVEFTEVILAKLKDGSAAHYGYELSPSTLVHRLADSVPHQQQEQVRRNISSKVFEASWILCERGILRPGVTHVGAQPVPEGGYCLTTFGRKWLREEEPDALLVNSPERIVAILKQSERHFGSGFLQRGVEATRCYRSHAYLAACAMCGAAAESILLALAIAKEGDEEKVIKLYAASGGRQKIENLILGQAQAHLSRTIKPSLELLKDWRDESAHGQASPISADEAATAIDMLVRFASSARKYWTELTGTPNPA